MQDQIEGRWKTALATEKELRIKALMEVQHEFDHDQASLVVEACTQHFRTRNRTGRVVVGEVGAVHAEGLAFWKKIMDQQKEAEDEIEKETKQDHGAAALDKGKAKEKESTKDFDTFTIKDIIGNLCQTFPI